MGNTVIQSRNDTASNWTSNNPVLALGELGLESDTNKFKFGDGSTAWNSLDYANSSSSSLKYGLYTLSANQTSNLAVGNHIEFDTSEGSLGGLATGSGQANGIITLAGGKTYKITASIDIACSSAGYGNIQVYDRTNSTYCGKPQGHLTPTINSHEVSSGLAMAIISPASDIDIDIRISLLGNWSAVYAVSAYALIEEYNRS